MEKADVLKQLDRASEDYRFRVGQRHEVRKMSVTVWAAVLVAVASNKLSLSIYGNVVILILPVFMFWSLEVFQCSITTRRQRFMRQLEERLATGNFQSSDPLDIYLCSVEERVGLKVKLADLITAVTTKEIMHLLYVLQTIASIVFVMLYDSLKATG